MDAMLGRTRTRSALASLLPRDETTLPFTFVDLFGNELDAYAEIIAGPGGKVAGFMTRGEDGGFGQRAQLAMKELGLDEASREVHRALAAWFENKRAFLKLEWHQGPDGVEPLVACYFRRRPSLASTMVRLAELGVGPEPLARARAMGEVLDKGTVHFVSAAFRPGRAPHFKLYFSQLADGPDRVKSTERVARVHDLFGVTGPLRDRWRELHENTVGPGVETFFVSMSCTGDELSPSFKIDYPNVSATGASEWRPSGERPEVVLEIERTCAMAGQRALTFLGVRFAPGEPTPTLKYYADVPLPLPPL
jgi:hypothetical protein